MVISKANAIHFYEYDPTGLQTFDNRLPCIETHYQTISLPSRQYCRVGSNLVIQINVPTGNTLTVVGQSGDGLSIAKSLIRTAGGLDYYKFEITSTIEATTYLTATESTGEVYKSSTIKFIDKEEYQMNASGYLKLEWFNSDNAFMMDYSTTWVNEVWVKGALIDYVPKSEATIFSNDEETVKLKDVLKRTLKLQISHLSRQVAEIIRVGMAHDKFYVNGVEYVLEEDAEITPIGTLVDISAVITDRTVLGLNTNDLGFTSDTDMNVKYIEYINKTATFVTAALPEKYVLTHIAVWDNDYPGSDTKIKIGSTLAGDDIMIQKGFASGQINDNLEGFSVEQLTNGLLYITLTGTSPDVDIYIQLIKNRS